MTKLNHGSKRQKLSQKYTIEKKANSHRRKMKKESKKSNGNRQRKKKTFKMLPIPNLCPFKDDMMRVIEEKRNAMEMEKQRRKLAAKAAKSGAIPPSGNSIGTSYSDMINRATELQDKFSKMRNSTEVEPEAGKIQRRYNQELHKIIGSSDVIVEVLDARDPNNCRSKEAERAVALKQKKLIFLLNKVDLVPKVAVSQWLSYLRREYPTVAFKCALSAADRGYQCPIAVENAPSDLKGSASTILGASSLVQLLKNYARSGDTQKSLTVGIIGYPNVGKSSVINSLKRSSVVKVGGEAGITRNLQEVQLDHKIKLIDSPGVLFHGSLDDPNVILRNAVKLADVKEPEVLVDTILKRCPRNVLMKLYSVDTFSDGHEFLSKVGIGRGKLAKGGVPDTTAAARLVLSDWTTGKFRYYCLPPKLPVDENASAEFVDSFSSTFNIDEDWKSSTFNIDGDWKELVEVDASAVGEVDGFCGSSAVANEHENSDIELDEGDISDVDSQDSSSSPSFMYDEEVSVNKREMNEGIRQQREVIKKRRRRALLNAQAEGAFAVIKDVFIPPEKDSFKQSKMRPTHRLRQEGFSHPALQKDGHLVDNMRSVLQPNGHKDAQDPCDITEDCPVLYNEAYDFKEDYFLL